MGPLTSRYRNPQEEESEYDSLNYDAIAVNYANSPPPKQESGAHGSYPSFQNVDTTYMNLNPSTTSACSANDDTTYLDLNPSSVSQNDPDVDTTYQDLNPSTMSDSTYTGLTFPSAEEHIYSNEVGEEFPVMTPGLPCPGPHKLRHRTGCAHREQAKRPRDIHLKLLGNLTVGLLSPLTDIHWESRPATAVLCGGSTESAKRNERERKGTKRNEKERKGTKRNEKERKGTKGNEV
uniref:Uncharacterized protein n=1 Tax=Branchiostoma floridae TaxID=7739 RepID=C3Y150_BRAFL|eukprot:XP_002609580.1 hypothetical protein BRAFLDRAFT_87793 [Branchiostoma floridae]